MLEINDDQFASLIDEAFDKLPSEHRSAVKNVAIVYADEPTALQREELRLQCNQTLFGLYEGVPLARRNGQTGFGPDKITIFKQPMLNSVTTLDELREQVRHTVWHEVAHYFGLDHEDIHRLER